MYGQAKEELDTYQVADHAECLAVEFKETDYDIDKLGTSIIESGTVRQYISQYASSEYTKNAAILFFAPNITLSFSHGFNYNPTYDSYVTRHNKNVTLKTFPEYYSNIPSLTVDWQVLDFSQLYTIKSLGFTAKAAKFSTAQEATNLIASGIGYYLQYIADIQTARASQEVVNTLQKVVRDVELLYKAGQRSKIDVLSLKGELNSFEALRDNSLADAVSAKGALNSLLPHEICPSSRVPEISHDHRHIVNRSLAHYAKELDTALQEYPAVLNLQSSAAAARNMASSYSASYLPTLSLSGSASTTNSYGNISGSYPTYLYQYDTNQTNYILASATWNIFDGGVSLMNKQSSLQKAMGFEESLRQTQASILANYNASLSSDIRLRAALSRSLDQLSAASKAQQLVLIAYKAGFKSYLDVISSVQSVYSALASVASTTSSIESNRYSLMKYLGYPNLKSTSRQISQIMLRGSP